MNMTTIITRLISSLLFVLILVLPLSGQMIWPGDLNNNGIVNGVDYLHWAVANHATGPVRPGGNTSWAEQPMGTPWANQFPQGTNYAYADANGEGQVNANDADALNANFNRNHGTLLPDVYPGSLSATDPQMGFVTSTTAVNSGQSVEIFFSLGNENAIFTALYGLTFTINYPPHALLANDGLLFGLFQDGFFNPLNANTAVFIHNNSATGKAVVTLVRTNQANVSGGGKVGRFILNFADLSLPGTPANLPFTVTNVEAIDKDMNPVGVKSANFSFTTTGNTGGCPNTASPVCGSNGVTYLNSCYAEAAGIASYTPGTCFDNSCIVPAQMNPNANCPAVYQPVCGCNGVTYTNECAATAAGVVSTTVGPCSPSSCYDPQYVVTSSATTLNPTTGVITENCPTTYNPVCGCNAVTYDNACLAQASGITVYTQGTCESACIDPYQLNLDAVCTTEYAPVCGCDGVTYTNACRADAAGVVSYTAGPCNGTSAWCSEAIPVQCGDFLPYETTVGAGNNILQYPGCSNTTFYGPDRVYVIQKETAGDLQIGLEILTPNLDLDIFLLAGNCSQVTCVGSSTTSNTVTNNEGIVLEDAPIGTYYIVVDGQYANSEGAFRLEVSCGYLYCGAAVALQCGQAYQGTNLNGNDDVSLYRCDGNVLNVENNGPEIVHTFTTTQSGPVSISLSGLSANLELFLLRSCDRGDCIKYSQQSGNANEYITEYLPAGTYYVVVDGYNGAVSNYTLLVDCASTCNLALVDLTATSSGCGQNSGSIHIRSSGGTPNYLITYSGPLSGSFTTSSNSCTIYYPPPGTYTITKTDAQGCSVTGTVTILGGGNLSATLTPHDAVCMNYGSVGEVVNNGQAPYHIYVSGPTSGSVTANANNFTINNLAAGNYTITITDYLGCSISQQVTINHTSGNFIWNSTVTPASCGAYGAIHINTYNGNAPYNVIVSGPISGGATVYANSFNIINLPGGTYQITVEDNNWCSYTRTVVVPDGNLTIDVTASAGACGQNGSVLVSMSNGTPNYTLFWTGPVNGSTVTSSANYTIPNLPSGSYTINVTDSYGCSDYQTVTVNNGGGGGLVLNVIPLLGSCTQNGALWIDIYSGSPTYTISWSGPQSGTLTTNADGLDIPNLLCGTYTVTITDINGCSGSQTVILGGCETIDVDLTPQNGICGQPGSVLVTINGGSPTYQVSWTGPVNGATTTNTNQVNLPGLPAGTYSVQVIDANGCSDYAVTQITTVASNLVIATVVTNASCGTPGAIGITLAGGVAPYQISWSGPSSGTRTINTNTTTLTGLTAGTYSIYVTNGNGCSATQTVQVLNVGTNLNVSLVGNDGICSQFGNIGVYITNGPGPYQISWTGPVSGSATSASTVYQIPNTPAGIYNVVVTASNGCSASNSVTINTQNVLAATLQPNNGLCGSTGSIGVNISQGTPNFTISWIGPQNGSTTIGGNQYTIANLVSGVYTVVIIDQNGCSRTLTTTIDNSNGGLDIQTALIYNICGQYNTIWVDIEGGTPPYTVTWQGTQNGSGTTTTQGYEIINLPPGTYKVTVVDANGCMDMVQNIIVYPAPINLFTATPVNGTCAGPGSILVSVLAGTPLYTLTWTGPSNGSTTLAGNSYTINNLPTGTYTLLLTDSNGCTENEVVSVSASEDDVVLTAMGTNATCAGGATITAQAAGGDGTYQLTWTGPESGSANIGTTPFLINNLPPGNYTLSINDGNGCDDTDNLTLSGQEDEVAVTLTPTAGTCSSTGQIAVNITGGTPGYTISWTGPSSGSTTINGQFVIISNLVAGSYTVTVVSSEGCSDVATAQVNPSTGQVYVTASPVAGTCGGPGYINLTISGAAAPYLVTWTGPANGSLTANGSTAQLPNLPAGSYNITVASGNCSASVNSVVPQPSPDINITTTTTSATCGYGGAIQVTVSNTTGATTISWNGPSSGSQTVGNGYLNIPNLTNGAYTLTAVNGNCSDVTVTTVGNTTANLSVVATPNPAICNQNGSLNVSFSGGAVPYSVSWTGPVSGSTSVNGNNYQIPNLPAGTYTVTVNSGNCTGSATTTITSNNNGLGIVATPQNGTCAVQPGFNILITSGVAPYQLSWQGPSSGSVNLNTATYALTNIPAGYYSFTVTDGNGCTRTVNGSVTITNLTINLTPQNGVCGDNTAVTVTINNGTPPYQISWMGEIDGFATTNSTPYTIYNLPGSPYVITVQDANGCSATGTVTVVSGPTDFEVVHVVSNNGCGALNNIWTDFYNGTGPYTVQWIGPTSGTETTTHDYYDIQNAPSGIYIIIITDANGCVDVQQVEVVNILNTLSVNFTPRTGSCGAPAAIEVRATGGQPWYTVAWYLGNQPVGEADFNSSNYTIHNLAAGSYYVRVTDDNGCERTTTVTVSTPANLLQLQTSVVAPGCINQGSVGLIMGGGSPPYSVSWSGPQSGSATANTDSYLIPGLSGGTYQVTVSTNSGCSNTISVFVPGSTIGNLVANFSATQDGLTAHFTNLSSNGLVSWNFGDGTSTFENNPTHTYAAAGTYQVCVTVQGACGNNTHCAAITVTASGSQAILDIGERSGGPGSLVSIPVTIYNVQNLISLAGTIEVMNGAVADILTVTPALIAPQFNPVNNTFSYFNNSGNFVTVNEEQVLFYLNVRLTGSVGQSTIIKFVQTPLPIEIGVMNNGVATVIPYTLAMGSATITNMAALTGQLTTYWGDGIMDAAVTITGPGYDATMMTDENGTYDMPDLNPGMAYTVSAEKDLAPANGLSTYALFIGQRFLLGMNPPQIVSPYQVIAGDANCNDAFTTLDLFLIQRLIIGAAEAFDNCPSWVFVADENEMPTVFDAYNVFPYASSSTMLLAGVETENFVGVKVVDILGQANPNNFGGGGDDRTTSVLPFVADNVAVAAGEEVTLYFRSNTFTDVVSYQFGLQFPANMVEFLEFLPAEVEPFQTVVIGDTEAAGGKLRLSWFSLDGQGHSAQADQPLFALRFRARTDITDWNNILRLDPAAMLPEAYNSNDEALDPEIAFTDAVTGTDDPLARPFALYQNTPNPWQQETAIGFYLPAATRAEVTIHDVFGQVVWRQDKAYGAGEQRLVLADLKLPAGVYYYSLRAGTALATRTMVVVD